MGAWLRAYIEEQTDLKLTTITDYEQVERDLVRFFGDSRRPDSIAAGDPEDFRSALKAHGLAEGTIRRRCKRAKQFFRAAERRKIIPEDPFEDTKCGSSRNAERKYSVMRYQTQAALEVCPEAQWRLIFALARHEGLRVSLGIRPLEWSHVDFELGWQQTGR